MAVIEKCIVAELGISVIHVLDNVVEWIDVLGDAEFVIAINFVFALKSN